MSQGHHTASSTQWSDSLGADISRCHNKVVTANPSCHLLRLLPTINTFSLLTLILGSLGKMIRLGFAQTLPGTFLTPCEFQMVTVKGRVKVLALGGMPRARWRWEPTHTTATPILLPGSGTATEDLLSCPGRI